MFLRGWPLEEEDEREHAATDVAHHAELVHIGVIATADKENSKHPSVRIIGAPYSVMSWINPLPILEMAKRQRSQASENMFVLLLEFGSSD